MTDERNSAPNRGTMVTPAEGTGLPNASATLGAPASNGAPGPAVAGPLAGAAAAVPPVPGRTDLVGHTLLDRYFVHSRLGEGGMGTVYLAEHTTIKRRFALKALSTEYSRKSDLVERFLQ